MERYKIRYGLPGPSADWAAVVGAMTCSEEHEVLFPHWIGHDTVGNFDAIFCEALNAFEAGEVTHLIQTHADVHPHEGGWLDVMVRVMEERKVSVVSCPIAIKDNRAVVSSGLADPKNPSRAWRMLAIEDLDDLPLDFDQTDLGQPDKILLHNHGCWLLDLRDPKWRQTDADGNLLVCFNFPRRNYRNQEGLWVADGNSEDWYLSRVIHGMGIKSCLTRRVKLWHAGKLRFPNWDIRKEKMAEQLKRVRELHPVNGEAVNWPAVEPTTTIGD